MVGSVTGSEAGRLQQVLDHGSVCGVVGVLLPEWRPGLTVLVLDDGMVWRTDRGQGEVLRDAELFRVDAAALDLLTLLGQARPQPGLPPSTARPASPTRSDPTIAGADVTTNGAWSADHATPAPADSPAHPSPTSAVVIGEADEVEVEVGDDELEVTAAAQDTAANAQSGNEPADDSAVREPASADLSPDAKGGATLRISVFGPPRVEWHGGARADDTAATAGRRGPATVSSEDRGIPAVVEVTSVFPARAHELLMVLAVHPDGITCEALTAALWPDSPPELITNALNTALSRLRRATRTATDGAVGDLVLLGHGRYRLDPTVVVVEDHHRFPDARHTRRMATADPQRRVAFQAMIDSYRGPFADGLSSECFKATRESLRREVLDAVAMLTRALADTDPEQALALLETARGFDPHNDVLYRDIMRLQARLRRHEAIPRTLALLTARLAEMGEQPDPVVIELARRLGHPRRHTATDSPPAADPGDTRTR